MGGVVQNMKIGRKLVLGFGAILVVMAMLVTVAIMNMSALHEDLVRIVLVTTSDRPLPPAWPRLSAKRQLPSATVYSRGNGPRK